MAESAKNSVKKGILGAAVVFGAVLLILAALIGIRMFRLSHRTTTTLQYISKVPYQNAYYANGSDTHGVVRIESDIDLKQYQADYDSEIEVSGEVTKLTIGHFDCMGVMMPCISYEFRADAVLKPEAPVVQSDESK